MLFNRRFEFVWCLPAACAAVLTLGIGHLGATGRAGHQTRQAGDPVGSIVAGQLLDAETGAPVENAVVTLAREATTRERRLQTRRVVADELGRFLFPGVSPSSYRLSASAPGYLADNPLSVGRSGGSAQLITVGPAQIVRNVRIHLFKAASLTGRISDEFDAPVPHARVTLFRREVSAAGLLLRPVGAAIADDHGRYRISSIAPGEYVVAFVSSVQSFPISAQTAYEEAARGTPEQQKTFLETYSASSAPMPRGAGIRAGDAVVVPDPALAVRRREGREEVWSAATTFYPSAETPDSAVPLILAMGETRINVDLHVRFRPAAALTGILLGLQGPAANVAVRLLPQYARSIGLHEALEVAETVTDKAGRFVFPVVAPGPYVAMAVWMPARIQDVPVTTLVIEAPTGVRTTSNPVESVDRMKQSVEQLLIAIGDLVADPQAMSPVTLHLQPAPRISGRIAFPGREPRMAGIPAGLTVGIEAVTGGSGRRFPSPRIAVDGSGQFVSTGLFPGQYLLRVSESEGWVAASADLRGRDLTDRAVDWREATEGVVTISMMRTAASVAGSVRGSPMDGVESAAVVLIPAEEDARFSGRRLRLTKVSADGMYRFSNVPPGDYLIAAVRSVSVAGWPGPDLIDRIGRAAERLVVRGTSQHARDLRILRIQ